MISGGHIIYNDYGLKINAILMTNGICLDKITV